MLYASIILFSLGAVAGLMLAKDVLKQKKARKPFVLAHGMAVGSGLILLIISAVQELTPYIKLSLTIAVATALVGSAMFINDLRDKPGPRPLVFLHIFLATLAIASILALVILYNSYDKF